jgi:ATP-dependent Zn protease
MAQSIDHTGTASQHRDGSGRHHARVHSPSNQPDGDEARSQGSETPGGSGDQRLNDGIRPRRSQLLWQRLAIHQAAHAVGRLYLGLGTIEIISIETPEGGLVAGSMDEFSEMTEELLAGMLVSTLSGRAAEQEILGSVVACGEARTHSDIDLANEFAFALEATPDFARKWPLLYRPKANRTLLLAFDRNLRNLVDARFDTAYDTARELVVRQQAAIEFLAGILFARKTLEGPELERLLEEVKQHMAP